MADTPNPKDDLKIIPGTGGSLPAAILDSHDDSPMTDKQAVVLRDLCERHGEPFDGNLTRDQADERIAYLKDKG